MKFFVGKKEEIEVKTSTELLLLSALKAILIEKGDPPSVKGYWREFRLPRFSFSLAIKHYKGIVEIAEDGNNGEDLVRLRKGDIMRITRTYPFDSKYLIRSFYFRKRHLFTVWSFEDKSKWWKWRIKIG